MAGVLHMHGLLVVHLVGCCAACAPAPQCEGSSSNQQQPEQQQQQEQQRQYDMQISAIEGGVVRLAEACPMLAAANELMPHTIPG
jgi:hypothetical protein